MNRKKSAEKFEKIDLYPVISSEFCLGRCPVDILKAVADGGARIVQLREKNLRKNELVKLAREFRRITSSYGMLLIINDYPDIALDVDADGVHIGQDDLSLEAVRDIAPELFIGVSTHSEKEALDAQSRGADYINIGPLFATDTKTLPISPLGVDVLTTIPPLLKIPFTVMGGIKACHIPELTALGARRIAMVTEITQAGDVTAKLVELRKIINANV